MARHRAKAGTLAEAVDHFLKVTRSYRPGLFHCYAVAGLPRTNNDLEQLFGAHRHHERRATGRKTASAGHRAARPGAAVAATATRLRRQDAAIWPAADRRRWREVRPASSTGAMPVSCAPLPPRPRSLPQPARAAPLPASTEEGGGANGGNG